MSLFFIIIAFALGTAKLFIANINKIKTPIWTVIGVIWCILQWLFCKKCFNPNIIFMHANQKIIIRNESSVWQLHIIKIGKLTWSNLWNRM